MGWKTTLLIILIVLIIGGSIFANKVYFNEGSNLSSYLEENENILKTIEYMEENGIYILGDTSCYWCKKQLNEFGIFKNRTLDKGLFLYCDLINDQKCLDYFVTPTWKKGNETILEGYIPLDKLNFENN